jgi:cytochrome c nitrite reductase small subunit
MSEQAPVKASPSRAWGFTLVVLIGVFIGLGIFTFDYAKGTSYFSDNPETCNNCHIMRDQFDAWSHSSHARVAVCNDCHTPHSSIVEKWIVKGINGFNHSVAFTLQNFAEPIRIRGFNADIANQNCVDCHEELVTNVTGSTHSEEELRCVSCHGNVGHATRGD